MRYLYGDSTASPLQTNFLAFVRDAIEFCVHLLVAQDRIKVLRDERRALDEHAESERARITGLQTLVIEAAEAANTDGPESISMRAVTRVTEAVDRVISSTIGELDTKLTSDRAALAAKDRDERDGCLDAFAKWVAVHEVHEGTWKLNAQIDDAGRYQGETSGSAPYGAQWKCAIELQATHPMAKGIRVGDVVTQIELALPEPSGWLKKGKLRPQRIDQYSIDSFTTDGTLFSCTLRVTPRGPAGLDVAIRGNEVQLTLVGAKEPSAIDASVDDRQRLLTLRDRILDAFTSHPGVRRRVVTATLDDEALADGDDLGLVAKRLIDAAAPIVKQIRAHSMSPNELVIRRLLGDDRREEIFVSTASLLEKLGRLPRHLRSMFAPLGLEWQRARTPIPGEIFVEPPRETPLDEVSGAEVAEEIADADVEVEDDATATKAAKPEPPSKPEPAKPEPSKPEPSKPEPAKPEPAKPEPAKPEPAKPEPATMSSMTDAASSIEAALERAAAPESVATTADPPLAKSDAPTDGARASKIAIDARNKETLAATVKRIVGAAREGRTVDAYQAYAALFEDSGFAQQRPQDQRQVLKLMVMSKNPPPPSDPVLHAYKNALARLKTLSTEAGDPLDGDLIGSCEQLLGSKH